jgi:CheY-like chemotaxis protein
MNDDELRILHVDDDEDDRIFLAEALQKLHLHHKLTGAQGCMDLFNVMREDYTFDMIILDVNMPLMDGKQCLKKIKAHEKFRDIPVIIFTVSSSQKDIDEVYESGAHYHVVKPYSAINYSLALKKIFDIDWKNKPPVPSKEDFVINFAFTQSS